MHARQIRGEYLIINSAVTRVQAIRTLLSLLATFVTAPKPLPARLEPASTNCITLVLMNLGRKLCGNTSMCCSPNKRVTASDFAYKTQCNSFKKHFDPITTIYVIQWMIFWVYWLIHGTKQERWARPVRLSQNETAASQDTWSWNGIIQNKPCYRGKL